MAEAGLVLATLGGTGAVLARLLVLYRSGALAWEREIWAVVALPFVVLAVVAVSRLDDAVARADPMLAGSLSAMVLGALGIYATWLGHRYDSRVQRAVGLVSLVGAFAALILTLVSAVARLG